MSDKSARQDMYNQAIQSGNYKELYAAIRKRCLNCTSGMLLCNNRVSCSHWMRPGPVTGMGQESTIMCVHHQPGKAFRMVMTCVELTEDEIAEVIEGE